MTAGPAGAAAGALALLFQVAATMPACRPAAGERLPGDTLFIEDFESGTLAAWSDNHQPSHKAIVTDRAQAHSGSRFLRVQYPSGSDGGSLTRFLRPGYDHVRVSYHVRLPADWDGGTKLILLRGSKPGDIWSSFGVAGKCPDGTDFVLANVVTTPGEAQAIRFYTYYRDMPREPDAVTCYGRYGDRPDGPPPVATYFSPLTFERDRWNRLELEVRLNDADRPNGWQRVWLNGTLRGEWAGIRFRTVDDLLLTAVTLEMSMSETGGSPRDQAMLIDDIVVTRVSGNQ